MGNIASLGFGSYFVCAVLVVLTVSIPAKPQPRTGKRKDE